MDSSPAKSDLIPGPNWLFWIIFTGFFVSGAMTVFSLPFGLMFCAFLLRNNQSRFLADSLIGIATRRRLRTFLVRFLFWSLLLLPVAVAALGAIVGARTPGNVLIAALIGYGLTSVLLLWAIVGFGRENRKS